MNAGYKESFEYVRASEMSVPIAGLHDECGGDKRRSWPEPW